MVVGGCGSLNICGLRRFSLLEVLRAEESIKKPNKQFLNIEQRNNKLNWN